MTETVSSLAHIFYLISNALLVPVMVGLLYGLGIAIFRLGHLLREWMERLLFRRERGVLISRLNTSNLEIGSVSKNGNILAEVLTQLPSRMSDSLFISKIVADAESYWQDKLEKTQIWIRLGPGIGLMGTLIPLGPGLVALADGDLKTLSSCMIIAFTTTVVGLLISLTNVVIHSIRKRWYRADSILLTYAIERFAERAGKGDLTKC